MTTSVSLPDTSKTLFELSGVYDIGEKRRQILCGVFLGGSLLGLLVSSILFFELDSKAYKAAFFTGTLILMYISTRIGYKRYKKINISSSGIEFLPGGLRIELDDIISISVSGNPKMSANFHLKVKDVRFIYLIGTIHWLNDKITFSV